ncbi:hypothetical protein [Acidithiobacillus sulfurivorans]|uniref:Uncharacterized protein n=1 Tax=Acidithiobacillus sulfurivorans TaxID=1958756 RepID=A0ABS5ZWP8_9PROT|nr:hypothetical protein [Acidithiobacillus sulfurivorans]MBU2759537.1 hypothetical protein [Acidithiobacillus sulfurivorans]
MTDQTDTPYSVDAHNPDDPPAHRDLAENRVFLLLLTTSRVLLLSFPVALLDAFVGRWVDMAINIGIGLTGVLLRIFLGLLNHEAPEQWFAEPPILRLILCLLYETDSCVAFKQELRDMNTEREANQYLSPRAGSRSSLRLQGQAWTRHRLPARSLPKQRLAGYRLQRRLQNLDNSRRF